MPTEVFFSRKMSICGSLPVTCGDVGGGVAPDFAGDVIFGPSLSRTYKNLIKLVKNRVYNPPIICQIFEVGWVGAVGGSSETFINVIIRLIINRMTQRYTGRVLWIHKSKLYGHLRSNDHAENYIILFQESV